MRGAVPPLPNTPSWRGAQLTGITFPVPYGTLSVEWWLELFVFWLPRVRIWTSFLIPSARPGKCRGLFHIRRHLISVIGALP
jgi:hypothetical protein